MSELSYPRLFYRGPADDTAETCAVADAAAAHVAQADGWRPTRAIPAGVVADVIETVTAAVTGHPKKGRH
jgi:hypothetical protein